MKRRIIEGVIARGVIKNEAQGFGMAERTEGTDKSRLWFCHCGLQQSAAYCAIASEAKVKPETGRPRLVRAAAAVGPR
jgi:nicotinate dehydrogenase subunit B